MAITPTTPQQQLAGLANPTTPVAGATSPAAVNPWTLNYNQFMQATKPFTDANGQINYNGNTGAVPALQLAGNPYGGANNIWNVSGAGSGIIHSPAMAATEGHWGDIATGNGENQDVVQGWIPATDATNEQWSINGDMSALMGQQGTDQHSNVTYERVGDQLVPVGTPKNWKWEPTNYTAPLLTLAALAAAAYTGGGSLAAMGGEIGGAGAVEGFGAGAAGMGAGATATGVTAGSAIGMDLGMLGGATGGGSALEGMAAYDAGLAGVGGNVGAGVGAGAGLYGSAAADSQLANLAINAEGGNALAGYTSSAVSPAVAAGASSTPGWLNSLIGPNTFLGGSQGMLGGSGGWSGALNGTTGWGGPLMSLGSGLYGLSLAEKQRKLAQEAIAGSSPWTASGGAANAGSALTNVINGNFANDPGFNQAQLAAARASSQQPGGFAASAAANAALKYQNDRIAALSGPAGVGFSPAAGYQNALGGMVDANKMTGQALGEIGFGASGAGQSMPPWLQNYLIQNGMGGTASPGGRP